MIEGLKKTCEERLAEIIDLQENIEILKAESSDYNKEVLHEEIRILKQKVTKLKEDNRKC
jgi:hypothetical protein